jgi:hypothetical protein
MLESLKPGEAAAILQHLIEAHPNLSTEAEGIARSLLHQVNYQEVAAEIEEEIRALDYEDLNASAGSTSGLCRFLGGCSGNPRRNAGALR